MALADVQTVRDALAARTLDTKLATRTALTTARSTLVTNLALGDLHVQRAVNNLDAVMAALQAGDLARATELLLPVVVWSLDNLLLGR